MNLLDKRVDVLRDEILLLYQRARGEGMGERFAHESMDLWVTFANDGPATICETPPVIEIALDKSPVAGSEIVYVFPRLRRVERQLVRRGPNYRTWTSPNKVVYRTQERIQHTEFSVQVQNMSWLSAAEKPVAIQKLGQISLQ